MEVRASSPCNLSQVTLSMRLLRRNCCLICCRSCRNTWQYQKIRSGSTFSKRLHMSKPNCVSMDSQTSQAVLKRRTSGALGSTKEVTIKLTPIIPSTNFKDLWTIPKMWGHSFLQKKKDTNQPTTRVTPWFNPPFPNETSVPCHRWGPSEKKQKSAS